MPDRTDLAAHVWRCDRGHRQIVSTLAMTTAVVHPRCLCGARLTTRVAAYPRPEENPDA